MPDFHGLEHQEGEIKPGQPIWCLNEEMREITVDSKNDSSRNIDNYIHDRVQKQIDWHDKKAIHNRKYHEGLQTASIILTSLASFAALLSTTFPSISTGLSIFSAACGSITTINLAIDKLKKYQELHSQYRQTCERLKQELWLYKQGSGEYAGPGEPDNNQLLVDRIESILATDTGNWAELNEKKET